MLIVSFYILSYLASLASYDFLEPIPYFMIYINIKMNAENWISRLLCSWQCIDNNKSSEFGGGRLLDCILMNYKESAYYNIHNENETYSK